MPAMSLERVRFMKLAHLCIFVGFTSFTTIVHAATINVRIVNGRSGNPISQTCVDVGADQMAHMLAVPTNNHGVAEFDMTDDPAKLKLGKRSLQCGEWGSINPVLRHAESFSIHVAYVLCQSSKSDYSWLARMTFSTSEVLERGVVTPNSCGKITASPKAGEVTIFVRPLNFWEKLKE